MRLAGHLALGASVAALVVACGNQPSGTTQVPVGSTPVIRTDIVSRQQVNGTLTYAGSYTVVNQAGPGVFTGLPSPGTLLARGQVLYRVDGRPIPLFYGDAPAWRTLSAGVAAGPDVRELQANLVALGLAPPILKVDNSFDQVTAIAVRHWQASLGLPQTGVVRPGDAVYMPGPIRVATVGVNAGMFAEPGQPVLQATSTQHVVTVQLSVALEPFVGVGDAVSVAFPDGRTIAPGAVSAIGSVATAPADAGQGGPPGAASVTMTITLTDPTAGGSLDGAPVSVGIVHDVHKGVLAVPVTALLAEPDGRYAVVVIDGGRRETVTVSTGLFDDRGLVEVTAPTLREGLLVEVPTT